MGVHGEVELEFGDGRHLFNISKNGQIFELQDKCGNVGIGTIHHRLRSGSFFFNDFRETIRLGLIGGGMKPLEALKLTQRYVDERPWAESVLTAQAIILAAYAGVPDEKVGKPKAGRAKTGTATTASSDPHSTELAQQ